MTTFNNIENPTTEEIRNEVENLKNSIENGEALINGECITADIYFHFNDGSFLSITPTWWNMGDFSGFHFSTIEDKNWLDDDADEGEISDSEDWLDETVTFILTEASNHGGIAYAMTTVETDED